MQFQSYHALRKCKVNVRYEIGGDIGNGARSRNSLKLDRCRHCYPLGAEEFDKWFRYFHILLFYEYKIMRTRWNTYCEVLYRWGKILTLNNNMILFAQSPILISGTFTNEPRRSPSTGSLQYRRSVVILKPSTYEVLRGSVYCTPLASSRSDASLRRLAMAARISASCSSAFSASVFFASIVKRLVW